MEFRAVAPWLFLVTFAGNILLSTILWQKVIRASLEILFTPDRPAARIIRPPRSTVSVEDDTQRMTDLVIPLAAHQVQRIGTNLATWGEFPPCSLADFKEQPLEHLPGDTHEFYDTHPHIGTNITLTFAVSGPTDQNV